MTKEKIKGVKTRILFCSIFILASLLLTGAGKIGENSHTRSEKAKQMKIDCFEAVLSYRNSIPLSRRDEWTRFASTHPDIFLRASGRNLPTEPSSQTARSR